MNTRNHSTYYAILVLAWLCALWAYLMDADFQAAQQAERMATARADQKIADRIERAAQAVCEYSHGPDAAHWWDGSVLICAKNGGKK